MDGALAFDLCVVERESFFLVQVGGRGGHVVEGWRVSATGRAPGADLGDSSEYSKEDFEG